MNSDRPVEEDDTNKAPTFLDQDTEADGDQTDQERTVAGEHGGEQLQARTSGVSCGSH